MKGFSINKFLISLAAPIGVLATALEDGAVTKEEWVSVGLTALVSFGVWRVPNAVSPMPERPAP